MTVFLTLNWSIHDLAASLQLTEDETYQYFSDGRRISFIVERAIRKRLGWRMAPSEGAGFDLLEPPGSKWEVRSITKGVYFSPSSMVGSGREFEEAGFFDKLDSIVGYLCADVARFPSVPVYKVPVALVRRLYSEGKLGKRTRITTKVFQSLIVPLLI